MIAFENLSSLSQETRGIGELNAAILAWTNELAPHGIFTTDAELRVTSWNQWLERHARKPAGQVIGKPLAEVIPSLVERRLDHYYRDALNGESKMLSRSLHGYLLPLPPSVPSTVFLHMQQSARIAPLLLHDKIYGTITIIEDVTEREWQHGILRQSRQRSELLATTLARLITLREPDYLIPEIFAQIAPPLRLDCCLHGNLDSSPPSYQFYSAEGSIVSDEERDCAINEFGEGLCRAVVQNREQLVIPHLQSREDLRIAHCKRLGFRAFAAFPLVVGNRLMGTLAFAIRGRDSFSGEEIQFLYTISQYAAVTLDRAQKEKRLRNSEERFRDMAETVPDIVFTVLPDGRRDYVSPRFYEVTGMPPGTGLGMGWMQALHPADVERVQLAWQQSTQNDQPYDVEYRLRTRPGGYRWCFARAKAIRDESNRVIRWFGVATDIEDLKQSQLEVAQAQAQLAQHAAELENTVRCRTAELRETISQLESFSYTVAHDLRAPIRTIEGYSQVLLEDYGQVLEEQAKKLLENMARAARRLDALTRDVLNYTKISTQAIELKPIERGGSGSGRGHSCRKTQPAFSALAWHPSATPISPAPSSIVDRG